MIMLVMMIAIRPNHSRTTTIDQPDISTGVDVAIAAVRGAHTGCRQMERALPDALAWSVMLIEYTTDVVTTVAEYAPRHDDAPSRQELTDIVQRGRCCAWARG